MSDSIGSNRFRAALHGYNRDDVIAYIERTTKEHEAAIRSLQTQNEQLSKRLAESKSALEEARLNNIAPAEYEAAKSRVTQLLTENQQLKDRIAEMEDNLSIASQSAFVEPEKTMQDLTAPIPAVETVLPGAGSSGRDYQELELAAYRRAELAERIARERAADVYREVSSVFSQADTKLDSGAMDLEQMTQTIQGNVNQLLKVLESIRGAFKETDISFNALREKNQNLVVETPEEE